VEIHTYVLPRRLHGLLLGYVHSKLFYYLSYVFRTIDRMRIGNNNFPILCCTAPLKILRSFFNQELNVLKLLKKRIENF
jgi:hypothetical protein